VFLLSTIETAYIELVRLIAFGWLFDKIPEMNEEDGT
jgi:hypothetical protein